MKPRYIFWLLVLVSILFILFPPLKILRENKEYRNELSYYTFEPKIIDEELLNSPDPILVDIGLEYLTEDMSF